MKVELDCGCIAASRDERVWDYGWWDCPTGHGRQKLWRIIHPEPPSLIARLHEHRARFIRQHGKRELAEN